MIEMRGKDDDTVWVNAPRDPPDQIHAMLFLQKPKSEGLFEMGKDRFQMQFPEKPYRLIHFQ